MNLEIWAELLAQAVEELCWAAEEVALKAETGPVPVPRFHILGDRIVWPFTAGAQIYWMTAGVDEETWRRHEKRWPPRARYRSPLEAPCWWDLHEEIEEIVEEIVFLASPAGLIRALHILRCAAGWARAVAEGDWERAAEFLAAAGEDPDPELEAEVALRVLGEEF